LRSASNTIDVPNHGSANQSGHVCRGKNNFADADVSDKSIAFSRNINRTGRVKIGVCPNTIDEPSRQDGASKGAHLRSGENDLTNETIVSITNKRIAAVRRDADSIRRIEYRGRSDTIAEARCGRW
jgi:ribosomal protein L16/L10AE